MVVCVNVNGAPVAGGCTVLACGVAFLALPSEETDFRRRGAENHGREGVEQQEQTNWRFSVKICRGLILRLVLRFGLAPLSSLPAAWCFRQPGPSSLS